MTIVGGGGGGGGDIKWGGVALRFAPVCPSVCPSVRHTLQYRVCVINSSQFSMGLLKPCLLFVDIMKMCMWSFGGDKINFDKIMAF